jgi:hypothetical protein
MSGCLGTQKDPMHVNAGGSDRFGIELAELCKVVCASHGQICSGRHDRIEIARGPAVDEIAPAIRFPGVDQRHVTSQRVLEHVIPIADASHFLVGGKQGADAGRCEEGRNTGTRRAQSFRERALWSQLELDAPGSVELVEDCRASNDRGARDAWIAADESLYSAGSKQPGKPGSPVTRIVGDDGEPLDSELQQTVDERVGLTDCSEATEQDGGAVADAVESVRHGSDELVDHVDAWAEVLVEASSWKAIGYLWLAILTHMLRYGNVFAYTNIY